MKLVLLATPQHRTQQAQNLRHTTRTPPRTHPWLLFLFHEPASRPSATLSPPSGARPKAGANSRESGTNGTCRESGVVPPQSKVRNVFWTAGTCPRFCCTPVRAGRGVPPRWFIVPMRGQLAVVKIGVTATHGRSPALFPIACVLAAFLAGMSAGRLGAEAQAHPAQWTNELSIQWVVLEVLSNNPSLKAARANWEALKSRIPQARAWEDPRLGVDVERSGTTRFATFTDAEWMVGQEVPVSGKN